MSGGKLLKFGKIQVTGVSIRFVNPIIMVAQLIPRDVFSNTADIRLNSGPQIITPNIAIEWRKMRIHDPLVLRDLWRDELVLYDNGVLVEKTRVTPGRDESIDWQFSRGVYVNKNTKQ